MGVAYEGIKTAIEQWGADLSRKDRQVLIAMLAEDFNALFPKKDRSALSPSRPWEATAAWRDWAAKNPMVSQLPEEHRHVSWLIWYHVGIGPPSSKRAWMSAVTALLEAAGGDLEVVEAAIRGAKLARDRDGIILKGPRSFIAWAVNLRSREVVREAEQLRLINLDEGASGGDRDGIIDV